MSKEAMFVKEAPANYSAVSKTKPEVPPGYKKTEVGVIPKDWDVKLIDDLGSVVRGGSPRPAGDPKYFNGTFIPWLTVAALTNIADSQLHVSETIGFLTEEGAKHSRTLASGTLIIANSGATLGVAKLLQVKCCANDGIAAIINQQMGDKEFVCHYINSRTSHLREVVATGNGQPNLNTTLIRDIRIPFPSAGEQRAIAAALSDVDALIAAQDKLIAKKRAIKTAAMQQLLTGKQRLPGFSGEWSIISMAKHASLKARIGWQALTTEEYLDSGTYYLVTGTDFINGRVNWATCHFVDEWRYSQDRNIQLKDGDVLLTKDGTIGKVGYVENLHGPATLNSGVFVIRPMDKSFDPLFLFYILTSRIFDDFLSKITAGSTITHLYQKDFVMFEFLALELNEQSAIAAILSDMDADIAALEARRAKTQAIKQGMMQELLTGRIRLLQEALDETQETARRDKPEQSEKTGHNWAFNEAVVISVLAHRFGTKKHPLGRMRCTKLAYLMHRCKEGRPEGYLKKAAGPYNPATRYKGPEAIAQKNEYIEATQSGKFSGFIAARNIDQALAYFDRWYGQEVLDWLDQFRYEKKENLELLATVDMAIQDLRANGGKAAVASVKNVLRAHPEWQPKLEREIFSDTSIKQAIARCLALFGTE